MALTERMRRWHVPGVSVAVIEGGRLAWARGYGVTQAGTNDTVTAHTRFQAASISKPVTAWAALRLVEQEALSLDEPVNRRLHTWTIPPSEHTRDTSVTLRALLSHTAGVTVSGFPGYAPGDTIPSLPQILNGAPPANTPPIRVDTTPGRTMRYSGGGYTVAQQLLTDVTSTPFAPLMDRLVLDPLGMQRSTFRQPLPDTLAAQAAAAHTRTGATAEGRWHVYPEQAAAGLWTTAPDLARFGGALHRAYQGRSEQLPRAVDRTMMNAVQNDYGLGLTVKGGGDTLRVGHTGSNRGYRGELVVYPETGDGAVVLTNGFGGTLLGREILRGIAAAYDWPGTAWAPTTKATAPLDPDQLRRFVGTYRSASGREVVIRRDEGQLMADLPVLGDRLRLRPMAPTRFFATAINAEIAFAETPNGQLQVRLYLGDQNRHRLTATRTEAG
jgi:CubicO group peptidase (beta-lactamase class C family)